MAPGIDLPDQPLIELRDRIEAATASLGGPARIVVFGCDRGLAVGRLASPGTATFSLPCIAALPPSFIDYVISRDLADGVVLTGCADGNCYHRFGIDWMRDRVAQERDPYLRARVPRERLCMIWASPAAPAALENAVRAFAGDVAALPPELGRTLRRDTATRPQTAEVPEHG